MKLIDLIGKHTFTGVELGITERARLARRYGKVNSVKFELDGIIYMATENPDDGYRSYMNELEIINEPLKFKIPQMQVVCVHDTKDEYGYKSDILSFIDVENGKVFLRIGTKNTNDYYPYCLFEYKPENMHYNQNLASKKPKYDRLTEKSIGCFKYILKDHKPKAGEFNDYDAFYNYSTAVKRLGELEDKIESGELVFREVEE